MSPLSHALFLVLKLANFEAKHARAKTITKDHLFLGLLKVVDVNLDDYFAQLSTPEQEATLAEIETLRNTLCILDTTQTRRALRSTLMSKPDDEAAQLGQPIASTGYTETLEKLEEETYPDACLRLLMVLLLSPGKGTAAQLKKEGAKAELILAALPKAKSANPHASFAQSIVEMHKLWCKQCPGKQPELSECWRRLAAGTIVEFNELGDLRLMQANHCLVHIPADNRQGRAQVFGASLADAFDEFEGNAAQKPCRVPLAEF
jgi:hypothetical protein